MPTAGPANSAADYVPQDHQLAMLDEGRRFGQGDYEVNSPYGLEKRLESHPAFCGLEPAGKKRVGEIGVCGPISRAHRSLIRA